MSRRLLDPAKSAADALSNKFPFEYRNSARTDIRETLQRARDALTATPSKVQRIGQRKKA